MPATNMSDETAPTPLEMRSGDVERWLRGELESTDLFTDEFLEALPPAELTAFNTGLKAQYGQVVGVENLNAFTPEIASFDIRFEKAIGKAEMRIDAAQDHRIGELLIRSFAPVDDDIAKIRSDLAGLPGEVDVWFGPLTPGADPVLRVGDGRQLAIGSTFKLYVLATLADAVRRGERSWDEVVPLDVSSFPSGQMHDWPRGAPVTLHTLATMMISVSDNTATDRLIKVLGREAIEAYLVRTGHDAPAQTLPFLTTLELFHLKGDDALGAEYAAAGTERRRAILADLERTLRGNANNATPPSFTQPNRIDTLEWFAGRDDLLRLLRTFADMPDNSARAIMAVNPSLAGANGRWQYAGYKGGSEPGVLNLSWLLRDEAGAWHALVMSWNDGDAALPDGALEGIAARILAQ